MWPLSTRVKRSEQHRAGDVGGAVEVLAARVDEVDALRLDGQRGLGRHRVVDDGAVLGVAGDGAEAQALEVVALAPEALELLGGADLGDPALGHRVVQPAQEAHHRRAVAHVGAAHAVELGLVLARLHRDDR
jgi:hypothetical protein